MYHKKKVFWAACSGMLLFGIGLITLGSIAPDLKQKFGLDDGAAGSLFSILPIGILAGSVLFGPVCDRYGYKSLLVAACLLMFAGFEGIAYIHTLNGLRMSIFIFGLGSGIINGTTNAVVADISKEAKGANLSLLGVFFGLGALGMPFVLGILKNRFSSFNILAATGLLTLVVGSFFFILRFPPSKKHHGFGMQKTNLYRQPFIFLLAFYLFFQGSLEAILNNWTTTYLTREQGITEQSALFALTLYIVGMTLMRIIIGSVFRSIDPVKLIMSSTVLSLCGLLLLRYGNSFPFSIVGLMVLGAGLAAGFPIIMGLAGSRYARQSGTAIGIVLAGSLLGNMLINYLMGIISERYGIRHFTSMAFIELFLMLLLSILIYYKQNKNEEIYAGSTMAE